MKIITQNTQLQIIFFCLLFCSTTAFAQVGIGNNNPISTLDINGALGLREGGTLDLATGVANDNINLGTPAYSVYRIIQTGTAGPINIAGIAPILSNSVNGQIVILQNTTSQNITIEHMAAGAGARRILVPGNQNLTLTGQNSTVTLIYSDVQNRWMLISHDDNVYGTNIKSVAENSDTFIYASIDSPNTSYANMAGMTITFTPKHSIVYVNFSSSGYVEALINGTSVTTNQTRVHFELRNGTTTIGNTVTGGTDYDYDFDDIYGEYDSILTAWDASFTMFPVTVTPGVSTTISIRWKALTRLGNLYGSTINPIVRCDSSPSGSGMSHRSLTIID